MNSIEFMIQRHLWLRKTEYISEKNMTLTNIIQTMNTNDPVLLVTISNKRTSISNLISSVITVGFIQNKALESKGAGRPSPFRIYCYKEILNSKAVVWYKCGKNDCYYTCNVSLDKEIILTFSRGRKKKFLFLK